MKTFKGLVLFLLFALLTPLAVLSPANAATIPGYIAGEVGLQGFTTTSSSVTAVGGGITAQQTTHDSSAYQLAVAGDGDYTVSASCGVSDAAGNPYTVYFNQRNLAVAAGATVLNDYLFNPGIVRFHVSISGEATLSSASAGLWATKAMASGEKTATYSFGAREESGREFTWELPVVPNQQIELTARIDVTGDSGEVKRYAFGKSTDSRYNLAPVDVLPGEVKDVYLAINFTSSDSPPAGTYKGSVSGRVNLIGLPGSNFVRHTLSASPSKTVTANPGTYLKDYNLTGNQLVVSSGVPSTTLAASLDGSPLRWPWPRVNGQSLNPSNNVTVYPNNTTYVDFERAGGFLTGSINFSGSVVNEDLKAITLTFDGVGNVYDAAAKQWRYHENYFGNAILKRDTLAPAKPPSERDYQLFLTTGEWNMSSVSLTKQQQAPLRTSSVTFKDHQVQYDGYNFFGTPLQVGQGSNEQDFNYCLGSAIFRFQDPDGKLLSNPLVSGTNGTHKTNGVTDLTISSFNASASVSNVAMQEVELFGPPGDYTVSTIRYTPNSGVQPPFPARTMTITCGTTKVFDVAGPTLSMTSPQADLVTSAATVTVAGKAKPYSRPGFTPSPIVSVAVNGQPATLTPVSDGTTFTLDLALADGTNTLTVTATDASGMQATEQLIIYADLWQPTLTIASPVDGADFLVTEASIPLQVEAADRGYGFNFSVYLDGNLAHAAAGAADSNDALTLSFAEALQGLAIGEHVVTATATDRAGNSTTATARFSVATYQPPPVLLGLADQAVEATSAAGAVVSYDVTATSTCDSGTPVELFPAPLPMAQDSSIVASGTVNKTFQWQPVVAADGDPVQYRVQVSDTLDFATIVYSSAWQATTTWTQALPVGTWFWRVSARDSVHQSLQSNPAVGNSFAILQHGAVTTSFSIQNSVDCTLSGGCYDAAYFFAGPYEDPGDGVDRSFLMFDTSVIGAGVTVTAAKLKLDYQINDYVQADSVTRVHESTWNVNFPAYDGYVGTFLASQPIAASRPLGMVSFDIRPDYVAASGATKFALTAADEDYTVIGNAAPGFAKATSSLEVTYLSNTPPWAAPVLTPQANVTTSEAALTVTFNWSETTAADSDAVDYLVEVSTSASFAAIDYSSAWQAGTTWSQALPVGTWFWRVTARDAVHVNTTSGTAASAFTITYVPAPTAGSTLVTCTPASGSTFPLGTGTVSCTATDACGTAQGSFTVAVRDTTAPELLLPADLTAEATSPQGAPVTFDVTAADTVDPAPGVSCTPVSGSTFPIGATIVGCTAVDASGNTAGNTFWVTVADSAPPVLTVPADVTAEASGPLTAVALGQATATQDATISNDAPAAYPVGMTTVTWTATAANGKSASGTQKVTVTDTSKPLVTAPANLTVEATGSLTPVSIGMATASDAVGVVSITSDAVGMVSITNVAPATFPLGVTTVTWTATDAAGNAGTAVQTVTVVDTTPPVFSGLANLTIEATGSLTPLASGGGLENVSDAVGVASVTSDAPAAYPLGVTTVHWTATDAAGNVATTLQTVTVRDTTAPVLTVPADITVLLNTPLDAPQVQAFLAGASATDAVDSMVTISVAPPANLNSIGAKAVTFTATDDAGNQTIRSASIRVVYGGGEEFLEPVSLLKPFKQGSTVPVKIALSDASGASVTTAVVRISVYKVDNSVPVGDPLELEPVGSADSGNLFKLTEDHYQFNLGTKKLTVGTYQVRATLDDGTIRNVPLALK